MSCCGKAIGRRRRRTSSIYEKIIEERQWSEYYRRKNKIAAPEKQAWGFLHKSKKS